MTVDDFVETNRAKFNVQLLCRVASYSPQTYYARKRADHKVRLARDADLERLIKKARSGKRHVNGRRRVTSYLRRQLSEPVNEKRIGRLMRVNGWSGIPHHIQRRSPEPVLVVHQNLLKRNFWVKGPNLVWTTDVIEIATKEGSLFQAVHEDLFSRYVVGFAFSPSNDTALVDLSLKRAVRSRKPQRGLTHHSDQGSPFLSWTYQRQLELIGATPSCSAPGTPLDNACSESFFSTLRRECIAGRIFTTRAQAIREITSWIRWYNRERFHSFLGNLSPSEFEEQASQ